MPRFALEVRHADRHAAIAQAARPLHIHRTVSGSRLAPDQDLVDPSPGVRRRFSSRIEVPVRVQGDIPRRVLFVPRQVCVAHERMVSPTRAGASALGRSAFSKER